jgi:hypothetical protein
MRFESIGMRDTLFSDKPISTSFCRHPWCPMGNNFSRETMRMEP